MPARSFLKSSQRWLKLLSSFTWAWPCSYLNKYVNVSLLPYLESCTNMAQQKVDIGLILWSIPILLLARAANTFPLVGVANLRREKSNRIPFNHQIMMWFSGIRGAMAFSLTVDVPSQAKTVIQSTTLIIVFITVIIFGGLTVPILKALKIKVRYASFILSLKIKFVGSRSAKKLKKML